jgi:DNA polymerase-1
MSVAPQVWLIDAHYQIFRAYHSMPDLRAPDGSPVGALRGYTSTLIKFLREQAPTHVAVAYDHAMTSFRNDLYPDYKAGRLAAPEDLEPQFELCAEVTRGLGLPLYSMERFEADDIIATLTHRLVERGAEVIIITNDKDLSALVTERVSLFDLKKLEQSGPAEIEARMGVPPELVSDYLSLVGDSVDNIPGVPGIGAKSGAALLNHFGPISEIPDDFERWKRLELRGKQRVFERFRDGRESLQLSRQLVELQTELPIEFRIDELRYRGADRGALEQFFTRVGAESMLERVPRFAG